jgi:hypothetical protein
MKRVFRAALLTALLSMLLSACGGSGSGVTGGTSATLQSVSVTPVQPSAAPATTMQLAAVGKYSDGRTITVTTSAGWNSSDASIALVSKGLITAVSAGSTIISATYSGITGTALLTVADIAGLAVSPANPSSLAPGTTQQFAATGTFSDGTTTQNLTSWATWSSSDTSVANVGVSSGLATAGSSIGATLISAVFSGITSSATLTTSHVSSISVTPAASSVANGNKLQFAADGILDAGNHQTLTSFATWSSSNTSVGTFNNTSGTRGLFTSIGEGVTTITALFDSQLSFATCTVTASTLSSISVTPSSASVAVGDTQQFYAMGTYTDSSTLDITDSVLWHSSSTGIATIGSNGLATAAGQGTASIYATLSGKTSNMASLAVGAASLVSIAITPANPTVSAPLYTQSQQFTAMGTYSDSTSHDITTSVTWASSNWSAATIDNTPGKNGLATIPNVPSGTKTSTISATLSGVTGHTVLTVTP